MNLPKFIYKANSKLIKHIGKSTWQILKNEQIYKVERAEKDAVGELKDDTDGEQADDHRDLPKVTTAVRSEGRAGGGDVVNALLALGYNEREAQAAVKELPADLQLADAIRQALRLLAKS